MSKAGEIYKVLTLPHSRYFQFVSTDDTQLGSDVIAVFKYKGELTDIKQVLSSGVEFFVHTSVEQGTKQEIWVKIDKTSVIDFSGALFKQAYYEDGLPDVEPYEVTSYHSWVVWSINKPWKHVGSDIKKYPAAVLGQVYSPKDVVSRMEEGRFPGALYYGEAI